MFSFSIEARKLSCRSILDFLLALMISLLILACAHNVRAELIVTVQGAETEKDLRRVYTRELIRLALEATKKDYGAYKLVENPVGENSARALKNSADKVFENYFVRQSVSMDLIKEMGYVAFPVDLGIVGYRVAFVSKQTKERLKSVNTLEELKEFSIVQGIGWLDTRILRHNGFDVYTSGTFEGMFKTIALNRFDLFFRGANELLDEWNSHTDIDGLTYDESILLYYPLPRFFFTAKENVLAIERIQEGLSRAYENGSVLELWEAYYRPSLEFVALNKRRIFRITNPYIKELSVDYEQYIYRP